MVVTPVPQFQLATLHSSLDIFHLLGEVDFLFWDNNRLDFLLEIVERADRRHPFIAAEVTDEDYDLEILLSVVVPSEW